MALTKKSFKTHTNLFQFNGSMNNLIVLKETSKAGKTSQMIFGEIDTEHPMAPMERAYVSTSCTLALLCSATLGHGVCKPLSQAPVLFC